MLSAFLRPLEDNAGEMGIVSGEVIRCFGYR